MKTYKNNLDKEEVKTYISALSDTEKELKILLNNIKVYNDSNEIIKLSIVGNSYVKSILDDFEPINNSNQFNHFENNNKDEFTTILDTDSFSNENVEFFINIIGNQVEDSNYSETNLKKDFEKAYQLDDDDLFDIGTTFYVSAMETTLSEKADINEVKKADILKKDMDSKALTYKYTSLDEFDKLTQNDINEFGGDSLSEEFNKNFARIINSKSNDNDLLSSVENIEDDDIILSLLEESIEEFFDEFEEILEGDDGFYDDIFSYLEKVADELIRIEEVFEDEGKLVFDDPNPRSNAHVKVLKKLSNYSKSFNEFSNQYEQNIEKNMEFRRKMSDFAFLFFKFDEDNYFLEFLVDCRNSFEELHELVEPSLIMLMDSFNVMFSQDKFYGKNIRILTREFNRILDNLKDIRYEMLYLEKKVSKLR